MMKLVGIGVCVVLAFILAVLSIGASSQFYLVYLVGAVLLGVVAGLIKNTGRRL